MKTRMENRGCTIAINNVMLRYRIPENDFVPDDDGSQQHRPDNFGATTSSSSILFGRIGQTVFANNTVPGPTLGYSLFTQPVATPPGQL
jgi:hypothetical protein